MKSNGTYKPLELKIGYGYFDSFTKLDPANIQTIYESNLIENLFSRIVEFDENANFICVLCKKFWVDEKKIIFEFRNDLFTVDGIRITAKDAQKTLQRLMAKKTNTHGNLEIFLDTSLNESIVVQDNLLIINLKKSHYSEFFIALLASMDFSIIPNAKIDEDLDIDFRNTSGPYYVDSDSSGGNLILRANEKHPLYSESMAKKIEVVPVEYGTGVDEFLRGKIDVLDITYYPGLPQYEKLFSQKAKEFSFHKTKAINMLVLNVSKSALDLHSKEKLFYALKIISQTMLSFKKYGYGFIPTIEYFQANGVGHLSQDEIMTIKQLRSESKWGETSKPVVFGVQEVIYEKIRNALANYPEIKVKSYEQDPVMLPYSERPDILFQTIDSSFNEDVSLLSYNFSVGNFGVSKREGELWMKEFIDTPLKSTRIQKLKKFQLDMLTKPQVYPIGASPYWAIANSDLSLNFSEYYPGSSWWKIRRK